MNCLRCNRTLKKLEIPDIYPCFHCMSLTLVRRVLTKDDNNLTSSIPLVRKSSTDWKIGSNVQTQKNQLWEQHIEKAYTLWLNEIILE